MRFKLSLTPEAETLDFSTAYLVGIPMRSISLVVGNQEMTNLLYTRRKNPVVKTLVLAPLLSVVEKKQPFPRTGTNSASLQGPFSFGNFCPAIANFVEGRKKGHL